MCLQLHSIRVTFLRQEHATRHENTNEIVLQKKSFIESCFVIFCLRWSQSVLIGRFSVLKSCLIWVPQCICLGSYKTCSEKIKCWGRPRPESQKLVVEKGTHHLSSLYNRHSFAHPLQQLQTNPALFLLEAMESTTITYHKTCIAITH